MRGRSMLEALLIIHLIGLMLGAGGGFATAIAMGRAGALPPEQAAPIRGLGPVYAHMSTIGLVLLWVTGVGMFGVMHLRPDALPWTFWAKMTFVGTLTLAAIAIEVCYAQVKRGSMKAAALLPRLGPIAGVSSLLAVGFAVATFD